jgi:branched-chain amino acid transport system substrate-binding protein
MIKILVNLLFFFSTFDLVLAQPGVSDNEIILGQSAAFKGTAAALGSELWRGANAYFSHINELGGVKGRKIKVIPYDDGYEGFNAAVNTIDLARKDIFALFGYVGTPTIVKALPVIQKFNQDEQLFLFSNFTGAQPQREMPHNEYVFNVRASYRQETAEIVKNLIRVGYKKIGVFIQYDSYGRSGSDGVRRALNKNKNPFFFEATYKRGVSFSKDMSEQVKFLKNAGADAIISVGTYEASAAFIRDARLAGYNVPIINLSVAADQLLDLLLTDQRFRKIKLTNNIITSQVVPNWSDLNVPLVRDYQKAMKKYPGKLPEHLKDPSYRPRKFSFVSLEGYINAKIFVKILSSLKKITRAEFIKKVQTMKSIDIGLGSKISFAKKDLKKRKVYFSEIVDGENKKLKSWDRYKIKK